MIFGGYRTVWVLVMFDLPMDSPRARKAYSDFRKGLLLDGFAMMQFSVYIRHCPSEENADLHAKRIKAVLPDDGEVRILLITDKQFGRIKVFQGKIRKAPEKAPQQLMLF